MSDFISDWTKAIKITVRRKPHRRLCPTCGRRCVGFNLNGKCENRRYKK